MIFLICMLQKISHVCRKKKQITRGRIIWDNLIVSWWMNRILLKKRRKEGNLGRSMHGRKTWLCRELARLFLKLKGYHVLGIVT